MILLDSDGHSGIIRQIIQGDHWLFDRINQAWTSPFLDGFLPWLREAEVWVPFYLFLLVFITLNFKVKGWWWALYLTMTAIVSDLISSSVVKNLIFRYRPCRSPELEGKVNVLAIYCPTSSSFTSSHACNHFALATFIFLTLRHTSRWWALLFAWAFAISYAQVYVGVHFPIDVFCGALLGIGIGLITSRIFRLQFGTLFLPSYNHQHV